MTTVDTLRVTGGSSDVVERLAGLDQAVRAARGHIDDRLVDEAEQVVERAGDRLRLSSEHTVVALAGATGSGKSSLFNWLCGLDLAGVGIKRPTTTPPRSRTTSRSSAWSSWPTSCCGFSTRRSTQTRRSTTDSCGRCTRTAM